MNRALGLELAETRSGGGRDEDEPEPPPPSEEARRRACRKERRCRGLARRPEAGEKAREGGEAKPVAATAAAAISGGERVRADRSSGG